ncbi:DUF6328 family protein [Streptomyces sp. NPDC003656]
MPLPRHLRTLRRESARELRDLTLDELREELRAVQTGVQILFAFLLGLAFSGRFTLLDDFEVGVYIGTLILTVVTTAIIATPIALHRRMGHSGRNPTIVPIAAYLARTGLARLALALNGAVLLVTDFVLGFPTAIGITAGTLIIFTILWFLLPRALRPGKKRRTARRVRTPASQENTK